MALSINLWIMIVSNTEKILGYEIQMIAIMSFGVFVILIIGLRVQSKYPKMFLGSPEDAIQILMRFQFSRSLSTFISASKYFSHVNKLSAHRSYSTNIVRIMHD